MKILVPKCTFEQNSLSFYDDSHRVFLRVLYCNPECNILGQNNPLVNLFPVVGFVCFNSKGL
ncbi:putative orfan [Tupanvirus soda lake]|uniref:Orfan n=2 Tax=Tupanvirus TaxID=2094720 RepID=A0AC62AC24_9VIRU|nr:putative orfan [Tupanvirus soda lake]QKU35294.1 putative orfan [Tupanvirus soda lake]